MTGARVVRAAGALVEASPLPQAALYEIVRVGRRRLLGEVIRIQGEVATVQVFEDTAGLALEEPVESTGAPLQAELGPGLLGSVLDGPSFACSAPPPTPSTARKTVSASTRCSRS